MCTRLFSWPPGPRCEGMFTEHQRAVNRQPRVANTPKGPETGERSSTVTETPRVSLQFNKE